MYHYAEIHDAAGCRVYTTSEPTRAPCHQDGALKFAVRLYRDDFLEGLKGHVGLIQEGWHDLYEIDDYAVKALEALSWFELNNTRDWMPKAVRDNIGPYQFDPEVILKLKATYEDANKTAEIFKPQKEWGVFSKTLAETIKNEFLKARLKGKGHDAESFFQRSCASFRKGLKLAPWLKPLYELGYHQLDGNLFLAGSKDVCLFKEGDVLRYPFGVDGTTGSVREAVRKLLSGESDRGTPLKYFRGKHPEVFEQMKERDPDLFHKLAVKILFRD